MRPHFRIADHTGTIGKRCGVDGGSGRPWAGRQSSKVVQGGEPNSISGDVRYLIDFITTISDISPGLTQFD